MPRLFAGLLLSGAVLMAGLAVAQEPKAAPTPAVKAGEDPNDPRHAELREMRAAVVKAVNERNIDELLKHLHPDVVVIWQNAEISRKHQGVRDYYQKTLGGPDSILQSFAVDPTVDELTKFHGDTGIAFGTAVSKFKFKNGDAFDLKGPWSATVVKEDGRWQIAEFHASAGLFDNPVLETAKRALYWGCGASAIVGFLVGSLGVLFLRRRRAT